MKERNEEMSVVENHSNFTVLISSFSIQTETNREEGGEGAVGAEN